MTVVSQKDHDAGSGQFLNGLRILDFSSVVMGPFATQLLADMGADVIKVEPPGGDLVRYYRPQRSREQSGLFMSLHRNKRSVVLDLKKDGAGEALNHLVSAADVVLHNFRPAVARRLGLEYADLRKANDKIILCKTYGFGAGGPRQEDPAYDDVIQASSGLSDMFQRTTGKPAYVPSMISDKIVGQMAALAIASAAFRVATHGVGCEVEVPMYETMVAFNLAENFSAAAFEPPLSDFGWARSISPMRKPFPTSDGYVCILPYTDQNWRDFLTVGGQASVLKDDRFRTLADRALNIDALYKVAETITPLQSSDEWVRFARDHNIPASPITAMSDLIDEPHLVAVNMFETAQHPTEGAYRVCRGPVRDSETDWQLRRHAPGLGEHTRDILEESGCPDERINHLIETAVIIG
ncbi:CoA transferase [Pseudohalocynthiibacter aestuariivivens]|nr:CoA transferase [Pseudohalocynthiibacter aestuariivivens]QIE45965.1 CoA transferase [Pseudohalocynthiibacter aestuariivivens]